MIKWIGISNCKYVLASWNVICLLIGTSQRHWQSSNVSITFLLPKSYNNARYCYFLDVQYWIQDLNIKRFLPCSNIMKTYVREFLVSITWWKANLAPTCDGGLLPCQPQHVRKTHSPASPFCEQEHGIESKRKCLGFVLVLYRILLQSRRLWLTQWNLPRTFASPALATSQAHAGKDQVCFPALCFCFFSVIGLCRWSDSSLPLC